MSDQWYDRVLPPVYEQGGPLVDYILRTWGGERLFELYSTCRRETFAEDCRRILASRSMNWTGRTGPISNGRRPRRSYITLPTRFWL